MRERGRDEGRGTSRTRGGSAGDNGRCFFSTSVCLSVRPFPRFNSSFFLSVPNVDSILREMGRDDRGHGRPVPLLIRVLYPNRRARAGLDFLVAKKDGGAYSSSSAPNRSW